MPKAASSSKTTKSATRAAKEKPVKEKKEPRAPSAWQLFCEKNRPAWKEANPDAKGNEWMKALGDMWKDSPENPNRGKEPKTKKKKSKKSGVDAAPKDAASSSPPSSSPGHEVDVGASSDY
ncbi:hypothetical protein VKT23_006379 [Stygiomarasmius scandens]|uniref:HMG box domain-containing protein n=1 Tax=Marasmiellus scandens TaxID=2682957 RepID=A0ABR1JML6_9AGAR